MLHLLVRLLLSAVSLLVVAYVVPGFHVDGFVSALIAAIVIGLVNMTVGLVVKVLTCPLTCLTFGLFSFVVNALMLMLASQFVDGFSIDGFFAALIGGILLAIVNAVLNTLARKITTKDSSAP
jgi:putative membrane protein